MPPSPKVHGPIDDDVACAGGAPALGDLVVVVDGGMLLAGFLRDFSIPGMIRLGIDFPTGESLLALDTVRDPGYCPREDLLEPIRFLSVFR